MLTLIILNLLDCITTYFALELGLVEANPIMQYLFDIDILLGFCVKMLVIILAGLLCILLKKEKLLKVLNWIVGIIVIYNLINILIILIIK